MIYLPTPLVGSGWCLVSFISPPLVSLHPLRLLLVSLHPSLFSGYLRYLSACPCGCYHVLSMSASEVRQRHARRLASARYHRACSSKPACHVLVSVPKQQRSARLISSPESVIYSAMLEQCRSLAVALRIAARRIVKACYIWCDFKRADESALLNAAIREMKLCFGYGFGSRSCSTLIGLLNPGGHSIKYFENRESGVRNCNIEMDDEIAFKCITLSKTIVIKNADAAKKIGAHFRELSQTPFPLFCTPLRSKFGHSVGILAVDNLCSDAATLHGNI